jgi:hypothetical protein
MDIPYERIRDTCLKCLVPLARQGFRVAPDDALDLIHDFIADPWPEIVKRYDPTRGTPEALVYGSFARFARRRILENERVRRSLVDVELLHTPDDESDAASSAEDMAALVAAFDRLDATTRELLDAYFGTGAPSLRALGRRRSVSRVRAREMLLEALGRLASGLERPEAIAREDWRVAEAVWRDGFTIDEAASLLGIRRADAEAALGRVLRRFSENLGASRGPGRNPGKERSSP